MKKINKVSFIVAAILALASQPMFAVSKKAPNVGSAVLTVVGADVSGSASVPVFADSVDGMGSVWTVPTMTGLPATGFFLGTACSGNNTAGTCSIVGRASGFVPFVPQFFVSNNAGVSFNLATIAGLTTNGFFRATSCSGNTCIAAGEDDSSSINAPMVAIETAGSGSVASIAGLPTKGVFYGTGTTGTGPQTIFVAAGLDFDTGVSIPAVAVTTNQGASWAMKPISGLPAKGLFRSTSCTGTGATALCTAVGTDTNASVGLLAQSTDGGNTWAVVPLAGIPASSAFSSTSCTGTGPTAICIAAGGTNASLASTPVVYITRNGGATWAPAPIPAGTGTVLSASCSPNFSTGVCAVVGQDFTTSGTPLLMVSSDGGVTWAKKTATGATGSGTFSAVSCTANVQGTCVASGINATPVTVVTNDGGVNWAVVTVPLPATSNPQATAATS